MIVAQTPRLLLKQFSLDDVDGFFTLNQDPEVLQYTGDRPFADKQEVATFIREYDQYDKYGLGRWSLYLKSTGEYIGFSGLRYSPETNDTDIGFRLMRKYWGRGYATESARAALTLAFTEFDKDRVIARAMTNNQASHAVIQKLAMQPLSSLHEAGHEWLTYQLSRKDWQQ